MLPAFFMYARDSFVKKVKIVKLNAKVKKNIESGHFFEKQMWQGGFLFLFSKKQMREIFF